jgi:hypothetical protein
MGVRGVFEGILLSALGSTAERREVFDEVGTRLQVIRLLPEYTARDCRALPTVLSGSLRGAVPRLDPFYCGEMHLCPVPSSCVQM